MHDLAVHLKAVFSLDEYLIFFFFSTAKYFCSLFATDAYDEKLNYCSSFQYVFLRESLLKNKHLKKDADGLVLYTALLYYSLQCIFNVRERKVKYMLISTVRHAVIERMINSQRLEMCL